MEPIEEETSVIEGGSTSAAPTDNEDETVSTPLAATENGDSSSSSSYDLHALIETCLAASSSHDTSATAVAWQPLVTCLEQLKAEQQQQLDPTTTLIEILIQRNTTNFGKTPLHVVVETAPIPITKLFMGVIPFEGLQQTMESQDDNGNTPLHLACQTLFLDRNGNEQKRKSSKTKTIHNETHCDTTILEYLSVGAPTAHEMINHKGQIPLSILLELPELRQNSNYESVTRLVKSICSKQSGLVKRLVDENTSNSHQNMTILHQAVANRVDESILLALLESSESQTSIQTPDKVGRLPLHHLAIAVGESWVEGVSLSLLSSQQQQQQQQQQHDDDNNNNNNNNQKEDGDDDYYYYAPTTFANWLIQIYPMGVVHPTTSGDTPLHTLLTTLCQAKNNNNKNTNTNHKKKNNDGGDDDDNNNGDDDIFALAKHQRIPASVQAIIKTMMGPEVDALCPLLVKNRDSLTPMHICALFNAPHNIARIIMSSASFSQKAATITDLNQATPLHLICGSSHIGNMLDLVTVVGTADAALLLDRKDRTPLHVAAENKKSTKQIIKALIELNPDAAKVESPKNHRRMPFHLALKKKADESIIKVLLRAHPGAVKAVFDGNNSLFHEMCQQKTPFSTVQGLLPIYPEGVKISNEHGNLPLHLATAHKCSFEVVQALIDVYPDACRTPNKHNDLPVHYAAVYPESANVVKFLIECNPTSVTAVNENGQTPLDMAKSCKMKPDIIEFMEKILASQQQQQHKSRNDNDNNNKGGEKEDGGTGNTTEDKSSKRSDKKSSRHPTESESSSPTTTSKKEQHLSPSSNGKESVKNEAAAAAESDQRSRRSERRAARRQGTSDGSSSPKKKEGVSVFKDKKDSTTTTTTTTSNGGGGGDGKSSKRHERRAHKQTNNDSSSPDTASKKQAATTVTTGSPKKKEEMADVQPPFTTTTATTSKKQERRASRHQQPPVSPSKDGKGEKAGKAVTAINGMLPKREKTSREKGGDASFNDSTGSLRQQDLEKSSSKDSGGGGGGAKDGSEASLDLNDVGLTVKSDSSKSRKSRSRSKGRSTNGDSKGKLSTSSGSDGPVHSSTAERRRERRAARREDGGGGDNNNNNKPRRRNSKDAEQMMLNASASAMNKSRRARSSARSSSKDPANNSSRARSSDRARSKDAEARSRSKDRNRAKSKDRARSKSASRRQRRRDSRASPFQDSMHMSYILGDASAVGSYGEMPLHGSTSSGLVGYSKRYDAGGAAAGHPTTPTGNSRRRKLVGGAVPTSPGVFATTPSGRRTARRSSSASGIQIPVGIRTPMAMTPSKSKSSSLVAELVASDLHTSSRLFLPPTTDDTT